MTKRKPEASDPDKSSRGAARTPVGLRIVGGRFRGRKLIYDGQMRTRPMKDRLREAVFNLIGPAVAGKHALDLFAGTGALGLEALSRGAARATFIEQHYPTAATIRRNISSLGVEACSEIVTANVFIWARRRRDCPSFPGRHACTVGENGTVPFDAPDLGTLPWVVFCSPPYDFFVDRPGDMLALVGGLVESAPAESIFVVEADGRFDFNLLPQSHAWDIRHYEPAFIGIYRQ
jgi:16S rRNA (guanine966-N2)-methyltransferase